MVRRCLNYSVIQLVDMVSTNYKKYNSQNDVNTNKTKYVQPK